MNVKGLVATFVKRVQFGGRYNIGSKIGKNNCKIVDQKVDPVWKGISSMAQFNNFNLFKINQRLNNKICFNFCSKVQKQTVIENKGPLKPQDIPQQNLQVVCSQEKVQNQQVQVFHAKGTLSILDKVRGPKHHQSGQLYVLMYTCGQCNHRQIRSFTKNAYHKGVVLVRCQGCDKVHLVADNLGWFQDQPVNVQTLHKDTIKKVHDPAAISMFLQKAFGEEQQILKNAKTTSQEVKKQ